VCEALTRQADLAFTSRCQHFGPEAWFYTDALCAGLEASV